MRAEIYVTLGTVYAVLNSVYVVLADIYVVLGIVYAVLDNVYVVLGNVYVLLDNNQELITVSTPSRGHSDVAKRVRRIRGNARRSKDLNSCREVTINFNLNIPRLPLGKYCRLWSVVIGNTVKAKNNHLHAGSQEMGSQLVSEKPKKNKPSVGPISSFVAPRPLLVDLVANVGQKEAGYSKGSPRVLHHTMLAPSAKESGPSADANLRPPVKRKYLQPPMRCVVGAKPDSSSRGSDAESFFDDPLVCRDIVDKCVEGSKHNQSINHKELYMTSWKARIKHRLPNKIK
ncbi:hypothetical protein Tco_0373577 [Tanacetum coccineum]